MPLDRSLHANARLHKTSLDPDCGRIGKLSIPGSRMMVDFPLNEDMFFLESSSFLMEVR